APNAAGLARRKANRVAFFIQTAPHAVNPAIAQGFVDRLFPGQARFAGFDFVVAHQQLLGFGMLARQPLAKSVGRLEELRPHSSLKAACTFRTVFQLRVVTWLPKCLSNASIRSRLPRPGPRRTTLASVLGCCNAMLNCDSSCRRPAGRSVGLPAARK